MPVTVDTTTPRLSNFEAGVIAEMTRLQCREVELLEALTKLQTESQHHEGAISERDKTITDLRAQIKSLEHQYATLREQLPEVIDAEAVPIELHKQAG